MGTHDISLLSVVSAVGLLAAGCYDVHGVDPGPYVLDDFEDGNFEPADPNFSQWVGATFSPDSNPSERDLDAGFGDSKHALRLTFTIVDKANGVQQDGAAALETFATKPVDFARFDELDFKVSLASGDPPLSNDARLHVDLACKTAPAEDGSVPGDFYVTRGATYDVNWQSKEFKLVTFGVPVGNKPIQGGLAGCLARVNSIRFTVNADIPDGQTGRGVLHIDDVKLQ